jgi:hypothetical protein
MHREQVRGRRGERATMWACYCCGERLDDTIWFNRSIRKEESRAHRNERIMREIIYSITRSGAPCG